MKSIEILLSGGLGNQMFQYAYARSVQLQNQNCKLKINVSLYKTDRFNREFSLLNLMLNDDIEVINKNHPIIRIAGGLSRYNEKIMYNLFSAFNICIWRSRKYRNLNNSKIIYGYFQSEKYFKEYTKIIKDELHVKTNTNQKNLDTLKRIRLTENSVCFHIRRGDYISENLLVCDDIYYKKAIRYMRNKLENPIFFVFSDDIQWAKKNYTGNDFVYIENENRDYQELELMYNCKNFIMSNSSFSWWAQYLSDNNSKTVIAPSKWMPNDRLPDIYLDKWILME